MYANRDKFLILPVESQISRPQNLRVEGNGDGLKILWDPPSLGSDMLDHYVVQWYPVGQDTLAETVNTKHNVVFSKLC